jgi:hypothetical protein
MIKEIRFVPTGEVRQPRTGDWFIGAQNRPICAAQDFLTSKFRILRMVVVEEDETACHMANGNSSSH